MLEAKMDTACPIDEVQQENTVVDNESFCSGGTLHAFLLCLLSVLLSLHAFFTNKSFFAMTKILV